MTEEKVKPGMRVLVYGKEAYVVDTYRTSEGLLIGVVSTRGSEVCLNVPVERLQEAV